MMKKIIYCLAMLLLCMQLAEIEDIYLCSREEYSTKICIKAAKNEVVVFDDVIAESDLCEEAGILFFILTIGIQVSCKKIQRKTKPVNLFTVKFQKLCRKRLPRASIDNRTFVRYNNCIAI